MVGEEGEEKRSQHGSLKGSCAADLSVRHTASVWEAAGRPSYQPVVHSHPCHFVLQHKELNGDEGT